MGENNDGSDNGYHLDIPSPTPSFKDFVETAFSPLTTSEYKNLSETYHNLEAPALSIVAQPQCGRLRSRKELDNDQTRRSTLTNKDQNPIYRGPAVSIPVYYLLRPEQYMIGVSVTTVRHHERNCHYYHPNIIEDILVENQNDRNTNIVWYPIAQENQIGIISFPNLRIVKTTESELKTNFRLRPFCSCHDDLAQNQPIAPRKLIVEYNLKRFQLAFFIGEKENPNDKFARSILIKTLVYSDELNEDPTKESTTNEQTTSSSVQRNISQTDCRVYKYAPRYGSVQGNEDILIFYDRNLDVRNYGKLQITFQNTETEPIRPIENEIDVKGQLVSFKTPRLPFEIHENFPMKIIIKQTKRDLGTLDFVYMPKRCGCRCAINAEIYHNSIMQISSNKRQRSHILIDDEIDDSIVPNLENKTSFRQSISQPEHEPPAWVPNQVNFSSLPSVSKEKTSSTDEEKLTNTLHQCVESLFHDDWKPFLRLCRGFIKRNPEILHSSLANNHTDLCLKFISISSVEYIEIMNQSGKNILLTCVQQNYIEIIECILNKMDSEKLVKQLNHKKQNIFHILATNNNCENVFTLLNDYMKKKSINIKQEFDSEDDDHHTPLQLAVINSNLILVRYLLKYFRKNVRELNETKDNLVHLAVRSGSLEVIECLLLDGKLIDQIYESNSQMTPIELAKTLKKDEIIQYFDKICSSTSVH